MQIGRSKLSDNAKLGDSITDEYEYNSIKKIEFTFEYYYDEQLKVDFINLYEIYNQYDEFIDKVELNVGEILQNWKVGIGRKKLVKIYQNAFLYAKNLVVEMDDLLDKLNKSIQNLDSISHL